MADAAIVIPFIYISVASRLHLIGDISVDFNQHNGQHKRGQYKGIKPQKY
jgi:hypothetical protein